MAEAPTLEELKLRTAVIPYLVAGDWLRRQWVYRIQVVNNFGQVFIMAAAGLGFGTPWLSSMAAVGTSQQGAPAHGRAWELYGVFGGVLVLFWIALWTYMTVVDGQRLAAGVKSCVKQLRSKSNDLLKFSGDVVGVEQINEVAKQLHEIADRAIHDGAWPWDPFPSGPQFAKACEERFQAICGSFRLSRTPSDSQLTRRPKE